jgi:hypothetical protein
VHTTLLGQTIELEPSRQLAAFFARILAAPSGAEAEALAYGPKSPITPAGTSPEGLPIWSREQLVLPEWAYLQDAVARCRAARGELNLPGIMSAPTWSVAEAARSLGVSEESIRHRVHVGDLVALGGTGTGGAGNGYRIDRRQVEALTTRLAAASSGRVPALYAREGTNGAAQIVVLVRGKDGELVDGERVGDATAERTELVWGEWSEALVQLGTASKARAFRLIPQHGEVTRRLYPVEGCGLEVAGRWREIDRTNNRAEAGRMIDEFRKGVRRG